MYDGFKRIFDLGVVLVLSPFWLIAYFFISILIILKLGSPVLFSQERLGMDGKIFRIFKFRTMTDERDAGGHLLPDNIRLTPFGRFLRNTSLDELPGLFNVIRGDMSLVGPRPFIAKYKNLYNTFQMRRHEVRPGITGWAQVNGRNTITWEQKFDYDVWYVDHRSFWVDIKIIFLTLKKVVVAEGVNTAEDSTMDFFKGSD